MNIAANIVFESGTKKSIKNFNNKEFANNSKEILAYTLNTNEKKWLASFI